MRNAIPVATRRLSEPEQLRELRNQIAFLELDVAEKERALELLVDDNAEMDFLITVNENARTGEMVALYDANVDRIESIRHDIRAALDDIETYRRVLAERFGVSAP